MSVEAMSVEQEAQVVEQIREGREKIHAELSKVIVGQQDVIEQLLICLFAGGHCLITGAPGLAKTLLVRSVSQDLSPAVPADPVHARLDAGGHHRHRDSGTDRTTAAANCSSSKARSSPT